jgi:hypothetical protein
MDDEDARASVPPVLGESDGDKVSVWHLHGEALKPSTILLGYEHYASYLNVRSSRCLCVRACVRACEAVLINQQLTCEHAEGAWLRGRWTGLPIAAARVRGHDPAARAPRVEADQTR